MTKTTSKLTPTALLALGRLGHVNLASNKTAEGLRAKVAAGEHKGSVNVRLDYEITVGEDSEAIVAQSVPWKRFAGALLARMNEATREAVVRDLLKDGEFDEAKGDEASEELIQRVLGTVKKTVAGRITGTTTLTPID